MKKKKTMIKVSAARSDGAGDLDTQRHSIDIGRELHAGLDGFAQVELDGIPSIDPSDADTCERGQFPETLKGRLFRGLRPFQRYLSA